MRSFNYYSKVFELPLAVFSFTKNHFQFLMLNTKIIYKYESFPGLILDIYCMRYPHAMPILNISGHFLTPKTLNVHAV